MPQSQGPRSGQGKGGGGAKGGWRPADDGLGAGPTLAEILVAERAKAAATTAPALGAASSAARSTAQVAAAGPQQQPAPSEADEEKAEIKAKVGVLDATIAALGETAGADPELAAILARRVAERQTLRDHLQGLKPVKTQLAAATMGPLTTALGTTAAAWACGRRRRRRRQLAARRRQTSLIINL